MAQLSQSADKLGSELDSAIRATQGNADLERKKFNEMANAYGLNSGAIGQAGLAQSNSLQGNINNVRTQYQQNVAELEMQKNLLGQQYQSQILQAKAQGDYERLQMLYNEAVRQEEALVQQQQFQQQMALNTIQMMLQYGGVSGGSSGSGSYSGYSNDYSSTPAPVADYVDTSYQINDSSSNTKNSNPYVVGIPGLGVMPVETAERYANMNRLDRVGIDSRGMPIYVQKGTSSGR